MEDNNPRLGEERIGGRGDEFISGREGARDKAKEPRVAKATTPGTTGAPGTDDTDRRTREIRRDIERTREGMSETVDAIQDRLRPSNIAANAMDSVKTAASDKVQEFADTEPVQYVRANPIPTAMIGVGIAGLAWLAFAGGKSRSAGSRRNRSGGNARRSGTGYYEVDDSYGGAHTERFAHTGTAADYTPGLSSGSASNRSFGGRPFGETSGGSATGPSSYGNTGRLSVDADRMTNQVQRTWNENPLLMGAAAAVLGAIVGMAVPETERENQLMGETRDTMIEGVQQTVRDKVDQVQQAASNAVGQVQSAVGLTTESSGDTKEKAGTTGNQPKTPGSTDLGRS